MKSLVVFYSRTGITRTVAQSISKALGADLEEIVDMVDRSGMLGYVMAGKDATQKRLTKIKDVKYDPSGYDLVVVGTPVWAWTMSSPIRTYLGSYAGKFKDVAFFATYGGSGADKIFEEMGKMCEKTPKSALGMTAREVSSGATERIKAFTDSLKAST
jgi:flavodoxin